MSTFSKIKKGLVYFSTGELYPILEYLNLRPRFLFESVYSTDAPSYMKPDEINFVSNKIEEEDQFYPTINTTSYQIETNNKFDQLDFRIIGADFCEKIKVECNDNNIVDGNDKGGDIEINLGGRSEPTIPISVNLEEPTTTAKFNITLIENREELNIAEQWLQNGQRHQPRIEKPSFPQLNNTPVFLLSIDSLRHDSQDKLSPLLDEFDESAYIPEEPQTQGVWTPQSHASIFTGTHPGRHHHVGHNDSEISHINESLPTLTQVLSENGYRSSALVTTRYLYPQFGFGDGFDRFYGTSDVHYFSSKNSAREDVSKLISWLDEDLHADYSNIFYFWQTFLPHAPYIPPAVDRPTEIDLTNRFRKDAKGNYIKNLKRDPIEKDEEYSQIIDMYKSSVEYVANQAARLINYLKYSDIYEDSLIIVVGDHGEEFGERGFYGHNSLYDSNIRPFMLIKPPADTSWNIRDEIDFIDIYPTILDCLGFDIPGECNGVPIQMGELQRPRITERIRPDVYNISVEIDGWKGIFSYEENFPRRPDITDIENPVCKEFYRLESVRSGNYMNMIDDVDQEIKDALEDTVHQFIRSDEVTDSSEFTTMSQDTKKQLRDLGYM